MDLQKERTACSLLVPFIRELYEVYKANYFTYMEINPLVVVDNKVHILDLAARLDETANFLCSETWKTRRGENVHFPAPFGRDLSQEVRRRFSRFLTAAVAGCRKNI